MMGRMPERDMRGDVNRERRFSWRPSNAMIALIFLLIVTIGPYLAERRERLRQFQPGAPFEIVPGAGHWVQYEASEQFNRLLRTVLGAS